MTQTETQQEYQQDDRISNLPDGILLLILSKLELLRDAARTTVLSKRWRHLLGFRSEIVLDVFDFNTSGYDSKYYMYTTGTDWLVRANASVIEATKSILRQNRLHTINLLSVKFYLRDESIGIVRSMDEAMAEKKVLGAELVIIPEELDVNCVEDNGMLVYGRRFMTFFGAYPRAFGGLTDLSLGSLRLGETDMANVLSTCKKLVYLCLDNCDAGIRSVWRVEHSELAELSISSCGFERVELKWLPRLTRSTCQDWWLPSQDQYPLSFGYVPQLRTLTLSNRGSTLDKSFKLSEFLGSAIIGELDLCFQCDRIWIQPESSRQLGPVLQNLQTVRLCYIHEECDITWTMFFLEAAPLLKELTIQVWDHECSNEEDERGKYDDIVREIFEKANPSLKRELHGGFKHYNLRSLTVGGFQVEDKFMVYIRHIMEAAVNLHVVLLVESYACPSCSFRPSTTYPQTIEEKDLIMKQMSEWRSSPVRIEFGD
ncbi:unnamed protein product [Urochloa decumbens]|uniref:F-box/LRR-repeat protein 15/At3g58940/PEG3-like LRR domain-containing protein n=1 Tax=Urochloa decumbens TaxID=240449 RepID=A0ABC9F458_9POAL